MSSRNHSASPPVNSRQYTNSKRYITRSKNFVKKKPVKKSYFDYSLLFLIIFMLAFGLLMLYSTSSYNAAIEFGSSTYYLRKQLQATILGLIAMFIVANINYRKFVWTGVFGYIVSIIMIFLVLSPLGYEANGARRWIIIAGISVQPAEVAKISLILLLAVVISNNRQNIRKISITAKIFALCIPMAGSILIITKNMSSALIIVGIAFVMLFIASPKYSHYIILGVAGVTVILVYLFTGSGFRSERVAAWLDPESYAQGKGYQTLQSLYAIGSGGLTGKGLGQSVQKLGYVPEAQNDMVFSIICEELGLFGGIAVILLFLLMIWRFMIIANNAEDLYGSMIVIGVMAHISIQVILNIAVVTNVIPNTGITLPFISYGGTSVVLLLAEMGLVLSVSKRIKLE
ncbi:putative peptidoglycan glycosyltransferase FtsW [Lachnospiraceae bacterium 48-33]|jgi:Bacterial cell division membrane protein